LLEGGGRLRIGIGRAPVLRDAKRLERAEEIGVLLARHHADEATEPKRSLASNLSALASAAPSSVRKLSRKRWSWMR
jgi:hypothetical protein